MNPAGFGANISATRLWTGVTGRYGTISGQRKSQSILFMKWDFTELDVSAARWRQTPVPGICPFPTYERAYKRAFEKMLLVRKLEGKDDSTGGWVDAESVFRWWMEDDTMPGQYELQFDEDTNEVYY